MPRPINTEKRAELLGEVVRYIERHGLANLSLTPLAEEIGTTKRMLLYYFGSRENLLARALAASRPDAHALFDGVTSTRELRRSARALWEAITVGEQAGPVRMLLQLLSLAATHPEQYGELAADTVDVMIGPVADAFVRLGTPERQARARATLVVSGLRGLCQDRLVTGDAARTDAAARLLIDAAIHSPPHDA
ncbi:MULTISPECIES: TetR family transcriptional regulator [unclassified Streptomyces]|uniref:TetR family transcriptional regulator n=1 Tax=unclassified Streptomyces TaxID=2593676 RepID=UPI0036EDD5D0